MRKWISTVQARGQRHFVTAVPANYRTLLARHWASWEEDTAITTHDLDSCLTAISDCSQVREKQKYIVIPKASLDPVASSFTSSTGARSNKATKGPKRGRASCQCHAHPLAEILMSEEANKNEKAYSKRKHKGKGIFPKYLKIYKNTKL